MHKKNGGLGLIVSQFLFSISISPNQIRIRRIFSLLYFTDHKVHCQ